jgi:hypothetical protein
MGDTLFQSKNPTKRDPPSPWEAPPRLIYMLLLHKTGENVSGDIINAPTHCRVIICRFGQYEESLSTTNTV